MLLRATLLVTFAAALDGAVVIDRVAVILGKRVIKTSDIYRDLRLTEFLNREPLNLTPDAMRKAAERLIDQTIIRDEVARGGYKRPSESEAETLLDQLRKDRFGGDDARLRQELSRYGLTEDDLREQLLWQLTVLRFIDQRFRPAVQLSDEDVHSYYNQHLADLKREYPEANTLEDLQPKIRASLEGERINQALSKWLEEIRKRNHIEYKQGAFA